MTRRVNYHRLNHVARQEICWAGISIAAYVRHFFPDGVWRGDLCGCVDDRCRDGYHHDPAEECNCLPVWLGEAVAAARAGQS